MLQQFKGSFYSLFFILLNLVYLVIELSFNARVLDSSAALSPSTDFGQLEIYGRTLSASGATLLAWRLLVTFRSASNLLRLVAKFFMITLIVFPLVFIGQKKLVDDLVEYSSNETRRSAQILSLLKYGIANGFVEIDELSVDELTLQTPEGKMFITLSGLLAYNASEMRSVLERELDKIADYAIATEQTDTTRVLYKNYLYASEQIVDHYRRYQQLVNELERRQAAAQEEAILLYEKAFNQSMIPWLDYQKQLAEYDDIEKVPEQLIGDLQYLLLTSNQRINQCQSEPCFQEQKQYLELRLGQLLGFYSEPGQWCDEILSELKVPRLQCVTDRKGLQQQLIAARHLNLAISAGLSRAYASSFDYLQSLELRTRVFNEIARAGIEIDQTWQFDQYEQILEQIAMQLQKEYSRQFEQSTLNRYGEPLDVRMSIDRFSRVPKMQVYYAQALGEMYSVPVAIDLTLEGFERKFVAPIYRVRLGTLTNQLKAEADWYANGAPYEAAGKSGLRNLLVPPVALAFSLIFGLLNLLNLALNLVFLLIEEKLWLRWTGVVVLTGFILMLPLRQQYQIYDQTAYRELLAETEKSYGYWAGALDWVAKTEPLVYPLGNILRYNLLDGFSFD